MMEQFDSTLERLSVPFPPEQISHLPATNKRPSLPYVDHAQVTHRLNQVVPDWSYTVEPVQADGHVLAVIGTMTIGGVSRDEVGAVDSPSTYGQELKEAVSDFIRRAAMRFGVALDLWSKQELSQAPEPPSQQAASGSGHETGAAVSSLPAAPVSPPVAASAEVLGEGTEADAVATPEQRTRLLQAYGSKPSFVKAAAASMFGFERPGDVLVTELSAAQVEALIKAAAK